MLRCKAEIEENKVNKELGELMIYDKDMLQTLFGFLREIMHFAASVTSNAETLPQVSWLGIEEGIALATHGKGVELQELRHLCSTLLKKAEIQLRSEIKMGLTGIKNMNWNTFDVKDDLTNIRDTYSFILSQNGRLLKENKTLLNEFMENEVSKSFFSKGMNGGVILWRKSRCLK